MNKRIIYPGLLVVLFLVSCGNDPSKNLNQEEKTAVEKQLQEDQEAMDSLEKAIQAQINMQDTLH